VQLAVYVYWGRYWTVIYDQTLIVLAQILFTYAADVLLHWSRGDRYRLGFGQFPIILSTNLFLCFKDDWFHFQFLLILVAVLGKALIRWDRAGRQTHIFNPSALALFLCSVGLLATGTTEHTWAQEIAINLGRPDYIFLEIFFLGLIVQYLFDVTLVTLGAAAALYVLNTVYTLTTGAYWFLDAGIPIAVFLGLHLLVTDPATSPKTDRGRFVFGALYGAGVFAAFGLLEWWGAPRFYDKLLCVPILNIAVQFLDRVARRTRAVAGGLGALRPGRTATRGSLVYLTVWVGLFSLMYTTDFIGKGHPGRTLEFWETACQDQRQDACGSLLRLLHNRCAAGDPDACVREDSLVVSVPAA